MAACHGASPKVAPTPTGTPPTKTVSFADGNEGPKTRMERIADAAEDAAEVVAEAGMIGVVAAVGTAGIVHDAIRFEESTTGALVLEAGAALLEGMCASPVSFCDVNICF